MKNAILLHGTCDKEEYYSSDFPSLSNAHWFPWLQNELMTEGWRADTPEVFEAYAPTYQKWLDELRRYTVDEKTVLIGHSCGGGFLLRWMHENPNVLFKKVILVAPWLDPGNEVSGDMFDVEFNIKQQEKVVVYESDDDFDTIIRSVEMVKQFMPNARYVEFKGYGHFIAENNPKMLKFPELLTEALAE